MRKRYLLFWGIVGIWCMQFTTVQAQELTVSQQRIILDEAISTFEDYESYATINDDEIRYAFEQLFTSGNALIYNDLLGVSTKNELSVAEYSKKLREGLLNKKVTITNVKKEKLWYENNAWKVKLSFDKSFSYANKCGAYLSSSEFYGKNYHLEATFVYDNMLSKCKIEKISGSIDSPKKLSEQYFVYMKTDKRDEDVLYKGQKLSFNNYNQALLDGPYDRKSLRYSDPDMFISPVVDECGNVSTKYKARKFRIKLHYDFGLGNALELGETGLPYSNKTSGSSFGVDFGYMFPSKSSFKAGLFLGAGMTQSTLEVEYKNPDYSFTTSADVDGDSYTRHYTNLSMLQKAKLTELTIPFYLDLNVTLHPVVALFLDLGVKMNLNMSHKVDNLEGEANIYGVYPQYDNLRLDEQWGHNGFGQKSFSDSELDYTELKGISSMNLDAFAGAGLRINIPNTPLTIEIGANYLFGLTDIYKPEGGLVDLSMNGNSPLVYNTITGLNNSEHVHNMTEGISSIKRKALRLSAGIIIKL